MMTRLLPWALAALLAGCSRHAPPRERDTEAGTDAAATTTAATGPAEAGVLLPATMPAEAPTPGRAVMSFGMDVHRTWRADKARRATTAALSPLSIAGALALLHEGARGETRDELAHALHLSAGVTAADLLKLETRGVAGFEVSRGQRVFADGHLAVTPEYRHGLGARFASLDVPVLAPKHPHRNADRDGAVHGGGWVIIDTDGWMTGRQISGHCRGDGPSGGGWTTTTRTTRAARLKIGTRCA